MGDGGLAVGPAGDPDRYRLLRAQAIGGERQIWLAQRAAGPGAAVEYVSVGVFRPASDADFDGWRAHYADRARLLGGLRHPGLSPLTDAFEGPAPHRAGTGARTPALYLVADVAPGVPLRSWATAAGGDLAAKVRAFQSAAGALDLLHAGGGRRPPLYFGEIDPDDVVVDDHGQVILPILALEDDFPARGDLADRDAFARLVYLGLTGADLPENNPETVRRGMRDQPPALVEALVVMWHPDVRQRPASAAEWVASMLASIEPEPAPQVEPPALFTRATPARPAPPPERGRPWVLLGLLVAVLVPVGLAYGRPIVDRLLEGAESRLYPASIVASATADPTVDASGVETTFDVGHLVDDDESTAWRVPGDGVGQTITVTFDRPVRLARVGLVPGWAKVDPVSGVNRFTQNRTIERVRYTVDGVAIGEQPFMAVAALQTMPVDVTASTVTVEILATSAPGDRDFAAISELSFVGRRRR